MCCNNRTHVIVISCICLALTGISFLYYGFTTVATFILGYAKYGTNIDRIYGGSEELAVGIQAVIYVFWITSEILSIVGACKNNKCLLVPFMVCLALQILSFIGFGIYIGVLIASARASARNVPFVYALLYIIPLLVALGLSIYFLAINIKFQVELSSGRVGGVQPGMVLQPYTVPQGGVATNAYGPQGQMQKV